MSILDAKIQQLPKGEFFCTRNQSRYKWYRRLGKNLTYIPKKDKQLAQQLALRKFLSQQREELLYEKQMIEAYLHSYELRPDKAKEMLKPDSNYHHLLSSYFQVDSDECKKWKSESYERNTKHPENLIHKTVSGNMVRSKSEALIDMMLYIHKIPFRYESALYINGIVLYPDFTIKHPDTGKIYYWEHFGLMDDPTYSKSTCSKLQTYISSGIIPTIHLITTYETKENPLTTDMVEHIIDTYFV